MSVDFSDINYLAVVVAVVIQFAGGAAWYGILSAPWLAAIGKAREELPQGKSARGAPAGQERHESISYCLCRFRDGDNGLGDIGPGIRR